MARVNLLRWLWYGRCMEQADDARRPSSRTRCLRFYGHQGKHREMYGGEWDA